MVFSFFAKKTEKTTWLQRPERASVYSTYVRGGKIIQLLRDLALTNQHHPLSLALARKKRCGDFSVSVKSQTMQVIVP